VQARVEGKGFHLGFPPVCGLRSGPAGSAACPRRGRRSQDRASLVQLLRARGVPPGGEFWMPFGALLQPSLTYTLPCKDSN
jgi:hypothetical protein